MTKQWWFLSFAAICVVLFSATALASEPDFAGRAEIQLSHNGEYQAIRLVPAIYNHLNRNLSDILIKDDSGNIMPYFINSYETIAHATTETTQLNLIYSFVRYGDSFFDFGITSPGNRDILATSLHIQTSSAMFAKNIELLGSHDGVEWSFIRYDSLYRVGGHQKLNIDFGRVLRYTHYRIGIPNDGNNDLIVNGMVLEHSQRAVERSFFSESFAPSFDIVHDGRYTIIQLHGLRNVRINELTLHTDSRFQRPVTFAGGRRTELYNLNLAASEQYFQNLTLSFNGYSGREDILEVVIHNGDNAPIDIKNIELTYFADEIVFAVGNATSATLLFGNPTVTHPPVYDIANYRALILNAGFDVLPLRDIILLEISATPVPERDFSFVFNIVVVAVSLLLGTVILVRLRKSTMRTKED